MRVSSLKRITTSKKHSYLASNSQIQILGLVQGWVSLSHCQHIPYRYTHPQTHIDKMKIPLHTSVLQRLVCVPTVVQASSLHYEITLKFLYLNISCLRHLYLYTLIIFTAIQWP